GGRVKHDFSMIIHTNTNSDLILKKKSVSKAIVILRPGIQLAEITLMMEYHLSQQAC
uniref:Uncharacterized protein n=1 Tax=Oryza brachyantha TaxID=4533 RepID=J3LL89_ORYBR